MKELSEAFEELRAAALALYVSGDWSTCDLEDHQQKMLWENLRQKAGIPEGTATLLRKMREMEIPRKEVKL